MELNRFIELAKEFSDLGWSVQQQLVDVLNGESLTEQNGNALEMISSFLNSMAQDNIEGSDELYDKVDEFLGREHRL